MFPEIYTTEPPRGQGSGMQGLSGCPHMSKKEGTGVLEVNELC